MIRDAIYFVMVVVLSILAYRAVPHLIDYVQKLTRRDNSVDIWLAISAVFLMLCVVLNKVTEWFSLLATTVQTGNEIWFSVMSIALIPVGYVTVYDSPRQTAYDWTWCALTLITYIGIVLSAGGWFRIKRRKDGSYKVLSDSDNTANQL